MPLSAATHAAIGAVSGVIEVTLLHPTVAWKNALQEGRPLPVAPRALYRGYLINVGSFTPITMVQFGVNRMLESALSGGGEGSDLSSLQRIGVAATAGMTSSLMSTPCELVIIQQQRTCQSLAVTASELLRTHGASVLSRGGSLCMAREAIYTGGYLGTAPIVKAVLEKSPALADHPNAALLLAGVASGAAAAVLTQPLDTAKTRMQANLGDAAYSSAWRSMRTLWHEGGMRTLWAGLLPRGGRIVFATVILSFTKRVGTAALEGEPAEEHAAPAAAGLAAAAPS